MACFQASALAKTLNGTLLGADVSLSAVASLKVAGPDSLSFLTDLKHKTQFEHSQAGCVLLRDHEPSLAALQACLASKSVILVADPYVAFAKAMSLFYPLPEAIAGIHPSAIVNPSAQIDSTAEIGPQVVIGKNVRIGANCKIGAGCYIGDNSQLGDGCRLFANVSVQHDIEIGKAVIIQSGAIIGSDGFGNANENGQWRKINHIGRVIIGDEAEIGANTCIDRGVFGATTIGKGAKLDNLIQVAHNVSIGDHTAIAGSVGIAGSTKIGKHCMIGGGSGIGGHIEISDGCIITGMTMVTKSLNKPGVYSSGLPVKPQKVWQKNISRFNRSEAYLKRIQTLEAQVKALTLKHQKANS